MPLQEPRKSVGKYRIYCNIGYNLNEDAVRDYFQRLCKQGRVLDVYIPRHSSGRNKGYAFTTFQFESDLEVALQHSEHMIEGTVVRTNRAGPRPEYHASAEQEEDSTAGQASTSASPQQGSAVYGKGPRLYVGGIPDHITEQQIMKHFQRWGNVVDIYFPGKRGQKRVNYCFVTFDEWLAANRACSETKCAIEGEAVKSISVAEDRLLLPPTEQAAPDSLGLLDPSAFRLGLDSANFAPGAIGREGALPSLQHRMAGSDLEGLGGLAALKRQAGTSWPVYQPGGLQLDVLPEARGGEHEQMLLALQQQFAAQQQQEMLLQQQQLAQAQPPNNLQLLPRVMQELHAGLHDLQISPSTLSDIQRLALRDPVPEASGQGQPRAWSAGAIPPFWRSQQQQPPPGDGPQQQPPPAQQGGRYHQSPRLLGLSPTGSYPGQAPPPGSQWMQHMPDRLPHGSFGRPN